LDGRFYRETNGHEPVKSFFNSLPNSARKGIIAKDELLEEIKRLKATTPQVKK
jgi:hypothetical protein